MIAQGPVDFAEGGARIVRLDLVDPGGIVDLSPEVVGMGLYSVVAVVCLRDDHGEHFALGPGEWRLALHSRDVKLHARL